MACAVAGYMVLTLLVESGLLGSLFAKGKAGVQKCWGGLKGRRHRWQGYASLDEESPLGDSDLEDEDVKAERVALQSGTNLSLCLIESARSYRIILYFRL